MRRSDMAAVEFLITGKGDPARCIIMEPKIWLPKMLFRLFEDVARHQIEFKLIKFRNRFHCSQSKQEGAASVGDNRSKISRKFEKFPTKHSLFLTLTNTRVQTHTYLIVRITGLTHDKNKHAPLCSSRSLFFVIFVKFLETNRT